jgi:hypothetical protein
VDEQEAYYDNNTKALGTYGMAVIDDNLPRVEDTNTSQEAWKLGYTKSFV